MKPLFAGLLTRAVLWLLKSYRRVSMDLLRIEAAAWYVRGVGAARLALMGTIALVLLLALAVAGFVLLHIGLYALIPPPANAITLLALGTTYLLAAILALRWVCAEKTWMKYSKASQYVEKATRKSTSADA